MDGLKPVVMRIDRLVVKGSICLSDLCCNELCCSFFFTGDIDVFHNSGI